MTKKTDEKIHQKLRDSGMSVHQIFMSLMVIDQMSRTMSYKEGHQVLKVLAEIMEMVDEVVVTETGTPAVIMEEDKISRINTLKRDMEVE